MTKRKRLPEGVYLEVISLYESGEASSSDLAKRYDVSYTQIRNILIKHGGGLHRGAEYASKKAKNPSAETRAKMRQAKAGIPLPLEHRQKLRDAKLGRTHSAKTREILRKNALKQMVSDPSGYAKFRLASAQNAIDRTLADDERLRRRRARRTIRHLISRVSRSSTSRAVEILGYTSSDLRKHIESTFKEGMSWDDRKTFHIDHVIPVAAFLRMGIDDPMIINALPNLRALSPQENLRRSRNYDVKNFSADIEPTLRWLEIRLGKA